MRRTDGRIVERVRLPLDLVDAVAIEADRRGVDFDTCAGDLVAEALAGLYIRGMMHPAYDPVQGGLLGPGHEFGPPRGL